MTIYDVFGDVAGRFPGKTALLYKDDNGEYNAFTYGELSARVDRLAASIRGMGVERGDRVAIFAYHGPDWVMADLAVLKLGASVVPVYHTLSASAVRFILSDAGCKLIFAENGALFNVIDGVREGLPDLENVVVFDPKRIGGDKRFLRFHDLTGGDVPHEADASFDPVDVSPHETATIVYTSGTTGEPKGVVLSHANVVSNAAAAARRFQITPDDVFLSFLPLCHMFEKTCGYYAMLFSGATIAYAGDFTTIVRDVQAIRPTILIIVPRILEKIYEAVEQKVMESAFISRKLVTGVVRSLNRLANLEYKGLRVPLSLRLACFICDGLVASKFRKIAGGDLRLLVSGGAPLDRKLSKTLHVLGFNILEGYGLTEAAPVVCTACLGDNRLGTVGKPIDGVEVKIGEGDEILVRGANVMQGYFKRPEETAKAIDENAWLHTGDRGRFDRDGNLVITGRIKEIIVTSYGKNVPPVPIEAEITRSVFIENAMLYGDNRKYISALIVPRRTEIVRFADDNGIDATDYDALLAKEEIRGLIASEIESATADRARFEKVKTFSLLPESFTVQNKMLTPTFKLRRKNVIERYGNEIEAMYVEPGKR